MHVAFKECRRLHCRHEYGGVHALAAVIHAGIVVSVSRGERGIAVAVAVFIAHVAGERWQDAHAEVVFPRAVLRKRRADIGSPVLCQHMRIDILSLTFRRSQPDELQVHVVVGHGLGDVLHEAVHVIYAAVALERCAQRSADGLAQITAPDFAAVSVKIEFHVLPFWSVFVCHLLRSAHPLLSIPSKRSRLHARACAESRQVSSFSRRRGTAP